MENNLLIYKKISAICSGEEINDFYFVEDHPEAVSNSRASIFKIGYNVDRGNNEGTQSGVLRLLCRGFCVLYIFG